MRKKRPADKKIHELYVEKKLTCREIGDKYGVTRQAVHLWLKRLGITAEDNTKIHVTCKKCGENFFVSRYRWKLRKTFYCTVDCYVADRDKGYNFNRAGYHQSREIVKLYFNLKPKNIIHHVDGDSGINYEWTGTASASTSIKKPGLALIRGITLKNESGTAADIVYVAFDTIASSTTGIAVLGGGTLETNWPLGFTNKITVIAAQNTPTVSGTVWGTHYV